MSSEGGLVVYKGCGCIYTRVVIDHEIVVCNVCGVEVAGQTDKQSMWYNQLFIPFWPESNKELIVPHTACKLMPCPLAKFCMCPCVGSILDFNDLVNTAVTSICARSLSTGGTWHIMVNNTARNLVERAKTDMITHACERILSMLTVLLEAERSKKIE